MLDIFGVGTRDRSVHQELLLFQSSLVGRGHCLSCSMGKLKSIYDEMDEMPIM